MRNFNPFSRLGRGELKTVIQSRKKANQAERRLKELVKQYREILQDDRYKAVKGQLEEAMGENLSKLVDFASDCPRCSPRAERVRLLHEVISQPYHVSWYASQQERIEELAEIASDDNGRE